MATIVTRAGKGTPLTFTEVDANFTNLNNDKLEAGAIGTTIQGYDADLAALAALATTGGNFIVGNGSAWVAESGTTAVASLGIAGQAMAWTQAHTFASTATFADNAALRVGTGADLTFLHDGTNSTVQSNTGTLYMNAARLIMQNGAGTEVLADFVQDGGVYLRHNNTNRLWTTTTGVEIFGTLDVDLVTGAAMASQAEAEAGTDNTKLSTPLRVAQAITALAAPLSGAKFIATADLSNNATADFTLPAGYDAFIFVLQNVIPATDAVNLYCRTSTDGGATFAAGATDYRYVYNLTEIATGAVMTTTGLNVAVAAILAANVGSAASEDGVTGTLMLNGPHLAKRTLVNFSGVLVNASGIPTMVEAAFARVSSADVDAIRFLYSSGNLESGTITQYGLKNA